MSKICSNCGATLDNHNPFCSNCGIKIIDTDASHSSVAQSSGPQTLSHKGITHGLKNSQATLANRSLAIAVVFFILAYMVFIQGTPLSGMWAVGIVCLFGFLSSVIVFSMFRSRSKKMKSLITNIGLIASWQMSKTQQEQYANYLFHHEQGKNKAIFYISSTFIVLIFGIFIVLIEDGKAEMGLVMMLLLGLVATFAFGMPHYYRSKNLNADGKILIGKSFAYVNGIFHNWDFALSGIKQVKIVDEPFHGLFIQYFYTDRTFTNTEELLIPAPEGVELGPVVSTLKSKKH